MPSTTKDPVASPPPGPQMVPLTTGSVAPDRSRVVDLAAERCRSAFGQPTPEEARRWIGQLERLAREAAAEEGGPAERLLGAPFLRELVGKLAAIAEGHEP